VNLIISRKELDELAARARGIVESKPSNPVLGCVIIDATPDGVTATSYRSSMGYVGTYTANVSDRGRIAVDVDALQKAIKTLPPGPIAMDVSTTNLRLKMSVGKSTTTIGTLDPADHPGVVDVKATHTLTVDAPALRTIIDQTVKCIAEDDNKYGLSVLLLEFVGGKVRAVSTDGNRLAWSECDATGDAPSGTLVPRACVLEMRAMIDKIAGPVEIAIEPGPRAGSKPRALAVKLPGETLTIRCAEVDFPDYRQVLPTNYKRTWTVDRVNLHDTLRRFPVATGSNAVTVTLTNGTVHMRRTWDTSETSAEIDANYTGDRTVMGFNVVYLANALGVCTGTDVAIKMGDTLSPVVIEDPTNSAAQFVVMPVRLD